MSSVPTFEEPIVHSQEHAKFIPRVREVNEYDPGKQIRPNAGVCPILSAIHHYPELVSQIVEALRAGMQSPGLLATEKQFDAVGEERIVIFSLNKSLENFLIASVDQRFEDEDKRNHVLDFPPGETQSRSSVRKVVNRVGACRLIGTHTSHLTAVRSITDAALCEGRAIEVESMVTTRYDEVSYDLLISVDYEIPAERRGLLATLNQAGSGKIS